MLPKSSDEFFEAIFYEKRQFETQEVFIMVLYFQFVHAFC
jgi:hypothetical protein